jgi:Arc/MetJ-type ribon-helix-helix transcriptional regulator
MTTRNRAKKEFATRLSRETLTRLDQLVQSGRFKTRTAAIEAAVDRLYDAEQEEQEQLQQAFDRACGALSLGVDRERWRRAERDRLDWEASKTR